MKIVCLNFDNCFHVEYVDISNKENFHILNSKFHKCNECSSLAILVKRDFFFNEKEKEFYIKYLQRI